MNSMKERSSTSSVLQINLQWFGCDLRPEWSLTCIDNICLPRKIAKIALKSVCLCFFALLVGFLILFTYLIRDKSYYSRYDNSEM